MRSALTSSARRRQVANRTSFPATTDKKVQETVRDWVKLFTVVGAPAENWPSPRMKTTNGGQNTENDPKDNFSRRSSELENTGYLYEKKGGEHRIITEETTEFELVRGIRHHTYRGEVMKSSSETLNSP